MNRYRSVLRQLTQWFFLTVVALFVLLLIVSWLLCIYFDSINGLLSPHGIRWLTSHLVSNFCTVPFGEIILGLIGVGSLIESDIFKLFSGHISLKQKRALQTTIITVVIVLCVFSSFLLMPNAILLSAFGTISNSPFSKGVYGLIVCLFILIANVYGYTSGKFVTLDDFVNAHSSFIKKTGFYFIFVFFSSQFIQCLDYTHILAVLGDNGVVLEIIKCVLYYLPLAILILLYI